MENVLDFVLTVGGIAIVLMLITLPIAALAYLLIDHLTNGWAE